MRATLAPIPGMESHMSSFAIYLAGMLVLIIGLAAGAYFAGVAMQWIVVGAVVLLGIGIEYAQGTLTATRMGDPADALANTLGVIAGLATRLTPWRDALLRFDGGRR